jgi:GT2 family glycosyltransferase
MTGFKCAVIIITHDNQLVLDEAIASVRQQTLLPGQIIIVDTGSKDRKYLRQYELSEDTTVIYGGEEIGFCRGNNIGYRAVFPEVEYVLFLNPDAFLFPSFIEEAIHFMEIPVNKACGMLTGVLYGYDLANRRPSGLYDSTGIFNKWYGRWYDRGQGQACSDSLYNVNEEVPAICGALMFCRKEALDSVLVRGGEVLDSSFFMYKEDIDLSLRLKRQGWRLMFVSKLAAYHCRGWNPDRKKMARKVRLLSARNEMRIQRKNLSPLGFGYSLLKYVSVFVFNL